MKARANVIANELDKKIKAISLNKETCDKFVLNTNKQFHAPTGYIMDYLSGRKSPHDASETDLFMLCWGFDHIESTELAQQYFTETEKRGFLAYRMQKVQAKFPLEIQCSQITDDQWIGGSDAQFYMQLRESQLVNYNENAQRTMTRVIKNGVEGFKITVYRKSVEEIKDLMRSGTYIPNVLTLNIPEGNDNFYYNDKDRTLVITKETTFDIIDGYHRYLAMAELWDENHDFNYPMGIQITHYSDAKARQLIWQEDKKNKMRKIDSESMNMMQPANLVTERLNADPSFIFVGQISRNEGIINYAEFSECVKYFYFRQVSFGKAKMAAYVNQVKRELVGKLNDVFDYETGEPKDHYDFVDLMVIFTGLQMGAGKKVIQECIRRDNKLNRATFSSKVPRKGLVTDVENFIKEEGADYV